MIHWPDVEILECPEGMFDLMDARDAEIDARVAAREVEDMIAALEVE